MDTVAQALSSVWNARIAERSNVRMAKRDDLPAILTILNEAIAARAEFDEHAKTTADIKRWFDQHDERYAVLVTADESGHVVGFGALSRYEGDHDAYRGVAEITAYLASGAQHRGLGTRLMTELEAHAKRSEFHKTVVRTNPANRGSRRLLRKFGYRVVGVLKRDAFMDGAYVDVMILEKLLSLGRYRIGVPEEPPRPAPRPARIR